MATFTLVIQADNAAFHDECSGEPAAGPELARILRELADSIDSSRDGYLDSAGDGGKFHDINGSGVGHWAYETEEV